MKDDGVIMDFRTSGLQDFRTSGLQDFRTSGLQDFRTSGLQDFRDNIVDSLRGFAIILVVIGHVIVGFNFSKFSFTGSVLINSWIYSFHMPFMFMIAGYSHGIKERFKSGQTYPEYLRKYMIDVYLPCMCLSFMHFFFRLIMLSPSVNNTENFRYASMSDIMHIPFEGYYIYWFICALFFVKILHLLLERYFKHEYMHVIFWLFSFIIINSFNKESIPLFIRHFAYGLYFHTGFAMKRYNLIPKKISLGIILLLAGTVCFTASHFYGMSNIFTRTGTSIFTGLSFFVIFYALNIDNHFLVTCGVYSMVIYCVHDYVIIPSRIIYRLTGLYSSLNPAVLFLLSCFTAVIIPLMLVRLYKNVKCLRWIEYIFYPGKMLLRK